MKQTIILVNGSEFGTTMTTSGHGFIIHALNQVSPNQPSTRGKQLCLPYNDETSSSSSTLSKLYDEKPPDKLSVAQEQTLQRQTKNTSSASSLSFPLSSGKQLIKPKPPPVAQAKI